jgi:Uma2 family endonuclease
MLMTIVSIEPGEFKRMIRERRKFGGDRYDEVWDGVYVMSPWADNQHQRLAARLVVVFTLALGADIQIFAGCNVSDRPKRWQKNYRCPDVAVFLPGNLAEDRQTHWFGGPDFAVEIMSRNDRSREKFDFYFKVGVRDLLLINRRPWRLELYRSEETEWKNVGHSALGDGAASVLHSEVLELGFRLVKGTNRPQIEVSRITSKERWLV